jgi:hypothetical protein
MTNEHVPAREAILGLLAARNLHDDDSPDVDAALDGMFATLDEQQPFAVALAAIELTNALVRFIALWCRESEDEIIQGLATRMHARTAPYPNEDS